MAEGIIILTDDASNTGKALVHEAITYGSAPLTRYRPQVVLAGNAAGIIVNPVNAQPLSDYGIPVWVQGTPQATVAGLYDEVGTAGMFEDNYGACRITYKRALHVNLRASDTAGTELFPVPAALGDSDANPTVTRIAAHQQAWSGAAWQRVRSAVAGYSGTGDGILAVNPNMMQRRTYMSAPVISPAAFVAGTAKDIWSLLHPSSFATAARLRRLVVSIYTNTVAGAIRFELYRITAAGTATAHVPIPTDASDAASTCTVGIAHTVNATTTGNALAIQGTGLTVTPAASAPIVLYDWQESGETKAPLMRASTAEGYCVRVTHSAASTVVFGVQATFTEEA